MSKIYLSWVTGSGFFFLPFKSYQNPMSEHLTAAKYAGETHIPQGTFLVLANPIS